MSLVSRAGVLLVIPLLALAACERRATPPNVIPPNAAAYVEAKDAPTAAPSASEMRPDAIPKAP